MSDEIANGTNSDNHTRKIPKWVWPLLVAEFFREAVPALFGVVTTILVLLKAGILQLAHWPVAAFIALIVIEVILIVLVFAGALIYAAQAMLNAMETLFSRLAKIDAPKRPRWLVPVDTFAAWVIAAYFATVQRTMRGR